MDKALRDEWVVELRSGKYKQGLGGLRSRDDEFCCLGVLCDVLTKKYPEYRWFDEDSSFYFGRHGEFLRSGYVPRSLSKDISLSDEAQDFLVKLNDSFYSFNEIADQIEKNL